MKKGRMQSIDKVASPLCRVLHALTGRRVSPLSRPFVRVMKLFLAKKHENRRTGASPRLTPRRGSLIFDLALKGVRARGRHLGFVDGL